MWLMQNIVKTSRSKGIHKPCHAGYSKNLVNGR